MDYALRIYDGKNLLAVVTTRSGLKVDEKTGKFDAPLVAQYIGRGYILFNITKQVEVTKGTLTESMIPQKEEKKTDDGKEKV